MCLLPEQFPHFGPMHDICERAVALWIAPPGTGQTTLSQYCPAQFCFAYSAVYVQTQGHHAA